MNILIKFLFIPLKTQMLFHFQVSFSFFQENKLYLRDLFLTCDSELYELDESPHWPALK